MERERTQPSTQFEKSMLLLENDLDALGWDQPPRLYAVMGDEDDWRLELVTEMNGHPVDFMRMMANTGHFADEVVGVAVATEGWRHPVYEEMAAKHPAIATEILDAARELGIPEEEAIERAARVYEAALSQRRPSGNPDRIEIRNLMVVMRDGRTMGVHRDRDSDNELMERIGEGRVVDAMKALLTGFWPKGLFEEDEGAETRAVREAINSVREAINKRNAED